MDRLRRFKRPSNGTVVGFVALFVAIGGTALAATGTLVNITDGTNPALIAHVNAQGQLRTSSAPEAPVKPFTLFVQDYNSDFTGGGYNVAFTTPTIARLAIDRITIANYIADTQARLVQLYYATVDAGQTCASGTPHDFRVVADYTVTVQSPVVDNLSTPLQFAPTGGRPWCLLIDSTTTSPGDNYFSYVHLGGYAIAGAAPVSASPAASEALPQQQEQQKP